MGAEIAVVTNYPWGREESAVHDLVATNLVSEGGSVRQRLNHKRQTAKKEWLFGMDEISVNYC